MTDKTHTPGPWHVGSKRAGNDPIIWAGKRAGCVALVNADAPRRSKEEADANAALLAAAPAMLESLNCSTAVLTACLPHVDGERKRMVQMQIEANRDVGRAIAAAKGGAA